MHLPLVYSKATYRYSLLLGEISVSRNPSGTGSNTDIHSAAVTSLSCSLSSCYLLPQTRFTMKGRTAEKELPHLPKTGLWVTALGSSFLHFTHSLWVKPPAPNPNGAVSGLGNREGVVSATPHFSPRMVQGEEQ